jgi:hypothetical protein
VAERAATAVLLRRVELPPEPRPLIAVLEATEFLDDAGEKNRCELD